MKDLKVTAVRLALIAVAIGANVVVWAPEAAASGGEQKACHVVSGTTCSCEAPATSAWLCGYNQDGTPKCEDIYTQRCEGTIE